MSLMVLEHLPRLITISEFSGDPLTVVGHTIVGLLPEYAGIGVLIGLYLAFALAIRRLALRGELDAFEAIGVSPIRWMSSIGIFALIGGVFLLLNQGWLAPAGEKQILQISQQMERGVYGFRLPANEFHKLGDGTVLHFARVDSRGRQLDQIFLRHEGNIYNADKGQLSMGLSGQLTVRLMKGQRIDKSDDAVGSFDRLQFSFDRNLGLATHSTQRQAKPLPALWNSEKPLDRALANSRLLWVLLALATPILAYAFARPPIRSESAIGLLGGLLALVGAIKSISFIETTIVFDPALDSIGLILIWTLIGSVALLARIELGKPISTKVHAWLKWHSR